MIDSLKVTKRRSDDFLSQMSIMTKGFHAKVPPKASRAEIIELLVNSVLIGPAKRAHFTLPKNSTYFFSGYCDCHRRVIHLGKICSRCSSGSLTSLLRFGRGAPRNLPLLPPAPQIGPKGGLNLALGLVTALQAQAPQVLRSVARGHCERFAEVDADQHPVVHRGHGSAFLVLDTELDSIA